MRVLDIVECTTVDGPGFRTSIYVAGCHHHCPGCHNPQSWDAGGGEEMGVEDILAIVRRDPFAGVTLSGGDPMFQAEECVSLCRRVKEVTDKSLWCYTGFTWEEIHSRGSRAMVELAEMVDVLVDGRFVETLRDTDLLFRGSANQRLIDVHRTLETGFVCLWQRD